MAALTLVASAQVPLTLASAPASVGQRVGAASVAGLAFAATLALLPFAARPGPMFPGFLLLNQTSLLIAYAIGAWILYAQFRRGRSLSLLLAASASLFTANMMVLQLASFPGVFGPPGTRLLGTNSETSTWLWTFWHVGPAMLGMAYAVTVRQGRGASFRLGRTGLATAVSVAATLLLSAASGAFSTRLLPWLPTQSTGEDYSAFVTSGVGPALVLFTLAALGAVWWNTRAGRTVLELWIAASLVLLALDSILTQAGPTRGSIGWFSGRIGAQVSAMTVLWAYLHEVNATYARAEKAAMQELQRIEASLRQSQKMEAIGNLTSGIAHDFNNLLSVMTSAFTLIRKRPGDCDRVEQMTEAGLKAVARGSSLTSQLLSFSRQKVLRPEIADLNAVLRDFEVIAARAVPDGVRLEWRLDLGLHPVVLDVPDFETAVLNLIVNARDATGAVGGRIVTSTRNAVFDAGNLPAGARIEDLSQQAAACVVVSVADEGPGMPQDVAARAFDPFFTTKEDGKGTGLGLSQVHEFARAASGFAIIHTGDKGTTIELWLPRALAAFTEKPASLSVAAASAPGAEPQIPAWLPNHIPPAEAA